MEEDYELISKGLMKELRTENKKLKKDMDTIAKNSQVEIDYKKLAKEISGVLDEKRKSGGDIAQSLEHIKDLNKSTLNNLLDKTQKLEGKFDELVSSVSSLADSVSELAEEISSKESNKELKEIIEELKKAKENQGESKDLEKDIEGLNIDVIVDKLVEIEDFMVDLKTLLASIKPGEIKRQ